MKNFLILVNEWKDKGLKETKQLCDHIRTKGGKCQYLVRTDTQKILPKQIPPDTECILVIGGDGTLIRAVRDTVDCNIPLIGVNMGKLGYLCELEIGRAAESINAIMKDEYILEQRMLLTGEIADEALAADAKMQKSSFQAFNDIVIHRTGALTLISLIVYVNGEYLNLFKGDGIILSTPTGSTGYNLSAGGPIVDPKAQLILITPINPHDFGPKSIVIDAQDEVVIEVGKHRGQHGGLVEVSFDGDKGFVLDPGGRIAVHRSESSARILKLSRASYLEILRRKMQSYHS